ncbi:MAG: DNA polymerase III subunit delta' [Sulfurovaceae bacterium]|nr:DNA polymerase III subunit delta' [Sulfurovaceae bacterium]
MILGSQVIITDDFEHTIEQLEILGTNHRFINIVKEDNFLVEDVKYVIEKASIASEEVMVIIMASKKFSDIVQNKLLKILEEPPPNKEFIILTSQKAMILDTIRSRLPISIVQYHKIEQILDLDIKNLTLQSAYEFIQKNQRTTNQDMKTILEAIITSAVKSNNYRLDFKTLELFSDAVSVLSIGSSPQFVLSTVLLKLLANKKSNYLSKGAYNATL